MIRLNRWLSGKGGFTLLELMVVVIILGILAAVAIPRFIQAVRKGRTAEALATVGIIKNAEERYHLENQVFTLSIGDLDIENPSDIPGTRYTYAVTDAGADLSDLDNMVITATGVTDTPTAGITVTFTGSTGEIVTAGI